MLSRRLTDSLTQSHARDIYSIIEEDGNSSHPAAQVQKAAPDELVKHQQTLTGGVGQVGWSLYHEEVAEEQRP